MVDNKQFWLEAIEELNVVNWIIVLICLFVFSFGGRNDFVKYLGLGALPSGQVAKQIGNRKE